MICKAKCVKKFKEHFKISIGNLKPPKKFSEQFNGLGNWGFICGGTGWPDVGEPGGQAWGNRCGWRTEHCL